MLPIFSWALYELALKFFMLNIVALYFVRWVTLEKGAPEFVYSVFFGLSTLGVAVMSPAIGVIADRSGSKDRFLFGFTLSAVFLSALLSGVDRLYPALVIFALANFFAQNSAVIYNALLSDVAPKERRGLVSGLGKMIGYLGAVVALYLIRPIVTAHGYRATFLPSALLYLAFSLPALLFVHGPPSGRTPLRSVLRTEKPKHIFVQLKQTLHFPGMPYFLAASFCFAVPVNIVLLFMSVLATQLYGLNEVQIINLIAFSTVFAVIGSGAAGYLSDRLGSLRTLYCIFVFWMFGFIFGALVRQPELYPVLGGVIGLALGSVWTVARALALSLVPREKIGQFFGLFNLAGYLAAVAGALYWGIAVFLLRSWGPFRYRLALLSLNIFMLVALSFLRRIKLDAEAGQ